MRATELNRINAPMQRRLLCGWLAAVPSVFLWSATLCAEETDPPAPAPQPAPLETPAKAAHPDGAYIEKWPGGIHKIEAFYRDGELSGPYKEYFENGRFKIRTGYLKGKRTGRYEENYDNGKTRIVSEYKDGELDGTYQEFSEDGKAKVQAGYAGGVLHGKYLEMGLDGRTLVKELNYIYGRSDWFAREKKDITGALAKIQVDTAKAAGLNVAAPPLNAPAPAPATGPFGGGGGRGRGRNGGGGGGGTGGGGTGTAGNAGDGGMVMVGDPMPSVGQPVTDALIRLKQARMIAGVPYEDITLKAQYTTEAQAAADLLVQLGHLDHNPPKPAGMTDEQYALALAGCQHGNLAEGMRTLPQAVMQWLFDSDDTNKDRTGHRRWNLNPAMRETGFGMNGKYYAIWSHDASRAEVPAFKTIPWPAAGYHPAGFFGPRWCWTVSLNPDQYQEPTLKQIQVSIWALDKNYKKTGVPLELDHLVVNAEPFGVRYAVIFRPKSCTTAAGNAFLVEITGLKTTDGKDAPYTQLTEFF